jgi:hypothetical protein
MTQLSYEPIETAASRLSHIKLLRDQESSKTTWDEIKNNNNNYYYYYYYCSRPCTNIRPRNLLTSATDLSCFSLDVPSVLMQHKATTVHDTQPVWGRSNSSYAKSETFIANKWTEILSGNHSHQHWIGKLLRGYLLPWRWRQTAGLRNVGFST